MIQANREPNKAQPYPLLAQITVCLLGVVLYLLSFTPLAATLHFLPEVLRQLGLGVFVFGATSFFLTHWYSILMAQQLDTLGSEIKQLTVDTFDLVKSARDSGIARIYAQRTAGMSENPDAEKAFQERVKAEFREAARRALESKAEVTIRMTGISLRAFFHTNGTLFQLAENALQNDRLKFQILLIDPFSAQAGLRSERESQTQEDEEYITPEEHLTSTLFQDLQQCTRTLSRFIDDEKRRVEVRLYSTAPSCLLIFVNESVFVETYHYGRSGVGGLKGGKIPVLEFHSDTSTYKELEGHFQHVWFKSRQRALTPGFTDIITDPRKDPRNLDRMTREFFWLPERDGHGELT